MFDNYSIDNNKKKVDALYASAFLTKDGITDVGSICNANGLLVQPVLSKSSRLHGKFNIPIKTDYFGLWEVYVLDVPNSGSDSDQILTTKEKLDQIREIFGLSVSQLSKALLSSRPSLHSWLNGEEPVRNQYIERINQIHQIALEWKRKSKFHYSPDRLMRQPLGDGPSMLQILEREVLNDTEIQDGIEKLFNLMQRQRKQMDHVKQRSPKSTLPESEKEKTRRSLTSTVYSK